MIIARLAAHKNPSHPDFKFTKQLLDFLVTTKTKNGKSRVFWVSSITLSELLNKESSSGVKNSKIYSALSSKNLNFNPFDNKVAFHMVNNYHAVLGKATQHSIVSDLKWNISLDTAREHITRDLMIMATGDYVSCDVALSFDKKTFYRLSKEVGVFCCLPYKKYFQTNPSGDIVFSYDRTIPDGELGYT